MAFSPLDVPFLSQWFQRRNAEVDPNSIPDGSLSVAKLDVDIATQEELDAGIGGVNDAIGDLDDGLGGTNASVSANAAAITALEAQVTTLDADLSARIALLEAALAANTGMILAWGSVATPPVSIPSGFLECNGDEVPQAVYPELYAVIGTEWGAAAVPSLDFKLPNITSRCHDGATTYDVFTIIKT